MQWRMQGGSYTRTSNRPPSPHVESSYPTQIFYEKIVRFFDASSLHHPQKEFLATRLPTELSNKLHS